MKTSRDGRAHCIELYKALEKYKSMSTIMSLIGTVHLFVLFVQKVIYAENSIVGILYPC